jgi:pyridoxamine 5'-phosphate oxidase
MGDWVDDLASDPVAVTRGWLAEARAAGIHEPEAAALATVSEDGRPSVRMVLVRQVDERGFCFFTNYESRKAAELFSAGRGALAFHWPPPLHRQVRVEGSAERMTTEESASYFATRDRTSQLGAWASPQSWPLTSRDELESLLDDAAARFEDGSDVPCPPFWGGFRIVPEAIELWQGRPGRLHDRARYERDGSGWRRVRLAP